MAVTIAMPLCQVARQAVQIATPPLRQDHLKAWATSAAVRRLAAMDVAWWLIFALLILFCPSLANLLYFTYYL